MKSMRSALCGLVLLCLTGTAMAQTVFRTIPAQSKCAQMTVGEYPMVTLGGQPRKLSVSARIWNDKNLLVQPTTLLNEQHMVCFVEDRDGNILRVWILTPDEANKVVPNPQ